MAEHKFQYSPGGSVFTYVDHPKYSGKTMATRYPDCGWYVSPVTVLGFIKGRKIAQRNSMVIRHEKTGRIFPATLCNYKLV